jgi:hypothetical protein
MLPGEAIPIIINYTVDSKEYGGLIILNSTTTLIAILTDITLNINSIRDDLIFEFFDYVDVDIS